MASTFHNRHRSIAAALGSFVLSASCFAQGFSPGMQGKFSFPVRDGLVLTAELRLPPSAPRGIVVLMHGGTGITNLEREDEQDLLAQGLSTVIIDSFSGRNYRPPAGTGAGAGMRPADRAADAFAVLRALAQHPDLKDKRAILFGRSHGGSATMVAATTWAKKAFAPDGPVFAGYIALYPGCQASYPEQLSSSGSLRLHVGALDDLTPAKPCEAAVERMKAAGVDASLTKYADAHHAFDGQEPVRYFQSWVALRDCHLTLDSVAAPLPTAEIAKCATRGASMGANRHAAAQFRMVRAAEIGQLLGQ